MPTFRARLMAGSGRVTTETLVAASLAALHAQVRARGSFVLAAKPVAIAVRGRNLKLRSEVVMEIFNLLAMELDAGILTEDALAALKDEYPDPHARIVLTEIHASIAVSKETLSQAFAQFPRTFPRGMIATIAAGEEQGVPQLAQRFADLRDQLKFRLELRKSALRATAYPAFLLLFALGVIAFLLVRLVPQLRELLDALGTELPASTRLVMAVSDLSVAYWPHAALLAVASIAGWQLLQFLPTTALWIDRAFLQIPFLGRIYRALVTAEIAKNYRALYVAGQETTKTFESCAAIVENRAVKAALLRAKHLVETSTFAPETSVQGDVQVIAEAFRSTGYFPTLALTIIRSGERAGRLPTALDKVADHFASEAQEQVDGFFAVFEKILFLSIAAVVGGVLVAMFHPIFVAVRNLR